MQGVRLKPRGGGGTLKETGATKERYEVINFYQTPPSAELTLDEFELFALDRLMVLRKIEDARTRGFKWHELRDRIAGALRQYMRMNSLSENVEAEIRKDLVSHFILRLAYCRTEDLRRWFITQECALFRFRLEELAPVGMAAFIRKNGLMLEAICPEEKASKKSFLLSIPGASVLDFERTTYFKIPFTQATDLVASRQVYLSNGLAYVPIKKIVSVVVARYRTGLSKSLMEASLAFGTIASDVRFGPLLQNMSKQYVGREFTGNTEGDVLRAGDLDALSKRSMPLCMHHLHNSLKREHKLKHWGRLQYGLFLKGAGLSMEDALAFFQTEFTKIMSVDQFTKQYAYGVRHMYGKEGKRTNYTPYSCLKIIMGAPPAAGDRHGCPFRHHDQKQLENMLGQLKLDSKDVDGIMGQVRGRNYQLACQRHWEVTHRGCEDLGVSVDGVGNHPNAWIQASMQFYAAKVPHTPHKEQENNSDKLNERRQIITPTP